jgi:hypothetical protein
MRSAQWVACLMGYFIGFCSAIVLLGLMRDLGNRWRRSRRASRGYVQPPRPWPGPPAKGEK